MSHQFGQTFFLVDLLFAPSFPCGKYGADHPLDGVKVAGGFCRFPFHLVL